MKRKLKAFTLLELIIVLAIFGIMMTAIMKLFEPVTNIYNTTAVVSNQRATEQGIANYIAENTRYAISIGVFQKQASADEAINEFMAVNPTDSKGVLLEKKDVEVICIDHKGSYNYSNNNYSGRIIRKVSGQDGFTKDQSQLKPDGTGKAYLALGSAYYGPADYYIRIDNFTSQGFDIIIDSDYYGKSSTKQDVFARGDNDSNYTYKHVNLQNTSTAPISPEKPIKRSIITDQTDPTLGTRTSTSNNCTYIVYSTK